MFINFVEMHFPLWPLSPKSVLLPRADCSLVFDCDFDIAKCEIVSGLPTLPSHPGTYSVIGVFGVTSAASQCHLGTAPVLLCGVCVSSSSAQIMI